MADDEIKKELSVGERIRDLRVLRGWSQADLAREAGVSQATIAKLETRPQKLTMKLAEIARALGVDPGELDPRFKRALLNRAETMLAERSADDWDRLIYAAVDEAFRATGHSPEVAARVAAEIQAAVDAPLRAPPGMTDADVVRRVVRWELARLFGSDIPK